MRKSLLLFTVLLCIPVFMFAQTSQQSVVASSGGTMENDNFSISWTLGEVVVSTIETNSWMLTQGFHQGNFIVSAVGDLHLSDVSVKLYPNPAIDYIQVEVKTDDPGKYRVEMVDAVGRVIRDARHYDPLFKINMKGLASGLYYFRITDEDARLIGTYKVMKRDY